MLKARFQTWLLKRFKLEQFKQLRQKDVLIFIYQQGYLYLVLILITFIAGVNYANNLILGFCFLISSILCISFYLTFKQLHGIQVELILPEVGRVNDVITVQLELKQERKQLRYLYFKVAEKIYPVLFEGNTQKVDFNFSALKRGKFQIPEILLYSTYPLGLVRAWTYFYSNQPIWIAPESRLSSSNSQSSHSTGQPDQDEFRELRNYQLGDSLQSVSWKQAARGQGLYVKQFDDQKDFNVICIDYERMPSSSHEEKLSLMMGLVDECEQHQLAYSLILPNQLLEQGQGTQHYFNAKLLLAKVESYEN